MKTTLHVMRVLSILWLLLLIQLAVLRVNCSAQTSNEQAIANRITQLQNQLREEQAAAVRDDATARQALQQQAASAQLSGSAGATMAQLYGTLAQSAANSANAHRARAQRLQNEIYQLSLQLGNGNLGASFGSAAPPGGLNVAAGSPNVSWSEAFLGGALTLSPDHVRYDDRDGHGNLRKDSFEASCSEIKEWKGNKTNIMNAFAGANPQMWDFHIKLRNGKNANIEASTEVEMNEILEGVSRACGAR
jgi:hypothetical protein